MPVWRQDIWSHPIDLWRPISAASFAKEVNSRLAKRRLVSNGRLPNRRLTSLVKEATVGQLTSECYSDTCNVGCRPWALTRYAKLRAVHAPGLSGTFSPPPQVSDPDMLHYTCVSHLPRCMLGSLTSGFLWSRWQENVPGIPTASATHNFAYLARGP